VVYPPYAVDPYGSLVVTVKGHSGDLIMNDPDGCTVTLQYSESGQASTVIDDVAPFSFEVIHRGLHEVTAACAAFSGERVTEISVASIRGGGAQQAIELHVELGEQLLEAGADASAETGSGGQSGGTEVSK